MNIIKGDLIKLAEQGLFHIIVHGCNCHNTMGAGIAFQLKEKYPLVYTTDCKTTAGDINKLGTYTACVPSNNFIVINAYTQYGFSNGIKDVFEYTAFELILQKLLHTYKGMNYGFPLIGCGLACGDINRILALLDKFSTDVEAIGGTVTLVEFGQ